MPLTQRTEEVVSQEAWLGLGVISRNREHASGTKSSIVHLRRGARYREPRHRVKALGNEVGKVLRSNRMAFQGQGVKLDIIIRTADLISVVTTMFQVKKIRLREFSLSIQQILSNAHCVFKLRLYL